MQDHYQILGIARDASPQVVRFAFEGKMKALADPAYAAPTAEKREEERRLKEAFVTLSVPAKRGPYDGKLAAFEEQLAASAGRRPPWLVPAAVVACVALAAGALWNSHSREKERVRLEEGRVAMEKENARRKAQAEDERLGELEARREEVIEATRQRAEQARIQRERTDYDRLKRTQEAQVRYSDSARQRQELNALRETQRVEERLRRAEDERRRAALVELERQKAYLRRQELEEERVRAARHDRANREAREREYQQYLEEQRRHQQQR